MRPDFHKSLVAGTERLAAWADVLDRINVFPVADGDTGRNLVLSLSPILRGFFDSNELAENLLLSARGNSGNIATRFLSGFMEGGNQAPLPTAAKWGNQRAWEAVNNPVHGTMLSFFDVLCQALEEHPPDGSGQWKDCVLQRLEVSVRDTTNQLPRLKEAGVVDSGALGMFIFFDGFLNTLTGHEEEFQSIAELFQSGLQIDTGWEKHAESGCCIDTVLYAKDLDPRTEQKLKKLGDNLVTVRHGDYVKVHLHAEDEQLVRSHISQLGQVVTWTSDRLDEQTSRFRARDIRATVHVMTDAAGSVTRKDAADLGITLLNSYINHQTRSVPETHMNPQELYVSMRSGVKVSTSQASDFERHQHYHKVLALYPRVLYLCVGSSFTGNYQTVMDWKKTNDPEDRLLVIDSGAASGRLGLAALATARLSIEAKSEDRVIAFARLAVECCREYVFLDKLHYLAAGGRLSKASAFFGDVLRMKPVVSPLPEGARKMGVVRSREDQVAYALDRLGEFVDPDRPYLFMLEYSDNHDWVVEVPGQTIQKLYPRAQLLVRPVSLTSGVHMGPGTWGLAFLPSPVSEGKDRQHGK
jgi:DegV family protein with EDD domain